MNEWINEFIGWIIEWNKYTNERIDKWMKEGMNECTNERMHEWTN